MRLSPDEIIFWQHGFLKLNATIAFTWGLMLLLAVGSKLITRKLSTNLERSRWQNLLEIIVTAIEKQIEDVGLQPVHHHSRFPAAHRLALDDRSARAVRVRGCAAFRHRAYVEPTFIMLPFNIISEVSRTLALAVRLFGNMMSGAMIIGILLSITPFIFPIVMTAMTALGLLTGMVQAYIFFVLATVYIAAATRVRKGEPEAEAEPVY
jgi:F-type H+-transporting ATPase subunit a